MIGEKTPKKARFAGSKIHLTGNCVTIWTYAVKVNLHGMETVFWWFKRCIKRGQEGRTAEDRLDVTKTFSKRPKKNLVSQFCVSKKSMFLEYLHNIFHIFQLNCCFSQYTTGSSKICFYKLIFLSFYYADIHDICRM